MWEVDWMYAYDLSQPQTLEECQQLDLAALAAGPVASGADGIPVFLRHADVSALLSHRDAVAGAMQILAQLYAGGVVEQWFAHFVHNADEALHSRLRALVWGAFSVRRMERMRPLARKVAEESLDALLPGELFDPFESVAPEIPLRVIGALLGIAPDDSRELREWLRDFWPVFVAAVPTPEIRSRAERATEKLFEFADRVIEEKRLRPRDDLISELARAEREGALSRFELKVMISGLLFAGTDTTKTLIALGLYLFAEHPEQLELLGASPESSYSAVEEMLRVTTPSPWTARIATKRLEFAGTTIDPGATFMLSLAAANMDPRAYSNPQAFDICRREAPHLSFGRGRYFCLGAALARIEAQEALLALAARGWRVELVSKTPRWHRAGGFMEPSEPMLLRFVR